MPSINGNRAVFDITYQHRGKKLTRVNRGQNITKKRIMKIEEVERAIKKQFEMKDSFKRKLNYWLV